MIQKHFNPFQKNPLEGQALRVFLLNREKNLREMLQVNPANNNENYHNVHFAADMRRFSAAEDALVYEYQGVQSNIDYLHRLRRSVVKETAANPADRDWQDKVRGVYGKMQGMRNLRARGFHISDDTLNRIQGAQLTEQDYGKTSVLQSIDNTIRDHEAARRRVLEKFQTEMLAQYNARFRALTEAWTHKTPIGSEHVKVQALAEINAARTRINQAVPNLASLGEEYLNGEKCIDTLYDISDDIGALESNYELRRIEGEKIATAQALEKELKDLERRKKQEIDTISEDHARLRQKAIAETQALIPLIAESKELKSTQKDEYIKSLEKAIKNLQKGSDGQGGSVGAALAAFLYSRDSFLETDPNDSTKTVPSRMESSGALIPKGLWPQLELLQSDKANPAERKILAFNLRSGLDKFRQTIETSKREASEILPTLLKNIQGQKERLLAPKPEPHGWHIAVVSAEAAVVGAHEFSSFMKRTYKRKEDAHVGELGTKLFKFADKLGGPLAPFKTLSSQYDKLARAKEAEGVKNYKDNFDKMDPWDVVGIVNAGIISDPDQAKAAMEYLAGKGRLNWASKGLLITLNSLQSAVRFDVDHLASETASRHAFYRKVRLALATVWGEYDMFRALQNESRNKYASAKDAVKKEFEEVAKSEKGGWGIRIRAMLMEVWEAQEHGTSHKVSGSELEAMLEMSMADGLWGGYAAFDALLQALAMGAISYYRASALSGSLQNPFPLADYFGTGPGGAPKTLDDIKKDAAYGGSGKKGFTNLGNPAFVKHMQTTAMNKSSVLQRIDKITSENKPIDHDIYHMYMPYTAESLLENKLRIASDGKQLQLTAIKSYMPAVTDLMDNLAYTDGQVENIDILFQNMVGGFTRFHNIVNNKLQKNGSFARVDESQKDEAPRAAGEFTGYGRTKTKGHESTFRDYENMMVGYLKKLDPTFFGYVFREKVLEKEEVARIVRETKLRYGDDRIFGGQDPKEVNELYQAVGRFALWLLHNRPNQVKDMYRAVRADQKANFAKMNGESVEDWDKVAEARLKQVQKGIYGSNYIPNVAAVNNNYHYTAADSAASGTARRAA